MSITAPGNQHKPARRIQQALSKNPYDTEALLQLAYTLDKPDLSRKRELLHRILYLEPTNQPARQMLFEIDRAAIGGDPSRLSAALILTSSPTNNLPEPPLILRYSLVHQFLVYLFVAGSVFTGLRFARNPEGLIALGSLLLFLLIPLWFVSVVIELRDSGLQVSRLFGIVRAEIAWREIRECRRTILGQGVRLITRTGRTVEVSSHVNGFPFILDILHQIRPDLFKNAAGERIGDVLADDFTDTRVMAKTFE